MRRTPTRLALGAVATVVLALALVTLGVWQALALWSSRPSVVPPAGLPEAGAAAPIGPAPGAPWFEDVAAARGIGFRHFDSATPAHYIQETMGSGLAWIDYDNDGWPDLFCVQDGPVRPKPGSPAPTNKLYRNNGDGTFTDVTEAAGLARASYGMGAAVGDYDNDGFDDLLVTFFGGVVLYHNEPDGRGGRRFADVTKAAGLSDPHWATSAAWGDIDGDGYLDLYVCNYVEVDLDHYTVCTGGRNSVPMACPPSHFANVPHRLYRNNGDGSFTDISQSSGVAAAPASPGLGVLIVDLDGDGRPDIYVANDVKPAFLFHNQGGGRFAEKALFSGCAYGMDGELMAGMGVQAGDLDGSGRPALFVTNFQNLPNVLFRNRGGLLFQEWSMPSGLGGPSIPRLGFGTVLADVDLDGRLDVAVANGHIHRPAQEVMGIPYGQEAQLFLGIGGGKFRDVSAQSGPYFRELRVGRGLAWADFDNDGRPDLAFSHCGGSVALLHNRTDTPNAWVRLQLVGDGRRSNRNAIGARVEVEAGGVRQVHFVIGGGSYLSASDRRLLVGLGEAPRADRITVVWPSGRKQEYRDLVARRGYRLIEGVDQPEPEPIRASIRDQRPTGP